MYGRVIFAALAVLFVFPLAAELVFGIEVSTWGPIEMAMVTAVVLGIDAFWWWVLFIRREPQPEAFGGVPDATALRSARALREAMALHGGDRHAIDLAGRAGRRALLEFKTWQTLIVLGVLGGFWLFTGGDLEHGVGKDEIGIWVAMVLTPTLILIFRLFTGLADSGIGAAEAQAAALGLRTVELPEVGLAPRPDGGVRTTVGGAAEMTGTRHGREVGVRLDGRDSVVVVHCAAPRFEVAEAEGKLAASKGAPAAVVDVIRSLRKAKRWRGIALSAGEEGVTIERHGGINDGWLYDLWLGEKLLEALNGQRVVT